MKIELSRLIKIQVDFVVDNKSVNRVDTYHHEWVETWYQKYLKVNIIIDVAIVNIMNRLKAPCNDVLTGISINYE